MKKTVWVTKYWQTKGIYSLEVEDVGNGMVRIGNMHYLHTGDFEEYEQAAKLAVEILRQKKIKSLKQQLAKIQNMTF